MCFIKRISLLLIVAYCRERGKAGGDGCMKQQSHQTRPKSQKSPRKGEKVWHPLFSFLTSFPEKNFFNCFYIQLALPTEAAATEEAKSACGKGKLLFLLPFLHFPKRKVFFPPRSSPSSPHPPNTSSVPTFFHRGGDAFLIAGKLLLPTMRALLTSFLSADPFTTYRIVLRAFTKKREGPASDALFVATDTAPPAAPIITNLTCHGADGIQVRTSFLPNGGLIKLSMHSSRFFQAEMKIIMLVPVQVEWRRPSNPRLLSSTPIHHYVIHLRPRGEYSSSASKEEDVEVEVMNDTVRNVAFLSNLTRRRGGGGAEGGGGGGAVFDLSVSAFVESSARPGRMYRGPPSLPRQGIRQTCSKILDICNLSFNLGVSSSAENATPTR